MTIHEALMAQFPIRRSKEQKQRFRAWVLEEMKKNGLDAREEITSRGQHHNLVIGDPEHAAVVFTAHYDTPANMIIPNLMMPRNLPMYLLYQLGFVAVLMALGLGAAALVSCLTDSVLLIELAFLGVYFGILCLMMYGPANKHNANDNTSGVAAVLEIARTLPGEHLGKCAFILFDNEEKGCLGSKMYARDHQQVQFMRLVINLDCVGAGSDIVVVSTDLARRCTGYHLFEKTMNETEGLPVHFYDKKTSRLNSDQKNFKCGVAVCACKRVPVIGYLTSRIHTVRDTVCDPANIDFLARALSRFVIELGE